MTFEWVAPDYIDLVAPRIAQGIEELTARDAGFEAEAVLAALREDRACLVVADDCFAVLQPDGGALFVWAAWAPRKLYQLFDGLREIALFNQLTALTFRGARPWLRAASRYGLTLSDDGTYRMDL